MSTTAALSTHTSPLFFSERRVRKGAVARPCLQIPLLESHFEALSLELAESRCQSTWNPLFKSKSRRKCKFVVQSHLNQLPEPEDVVSAMEMLRQTPGMVQGMMTRVEGALYTLADAAVASDAATDAAQKQDGGWLGGVTDALENFLKILKDGLAALKVPYAYGFAIILLTVLVKAATLPLTKKQVESTLAMQNLQPKIKAIQQRYAGDQERIQLETARLYKQAGVNPLAGCLPTLATIPVWIGLYRALSNVANEGLLTEGFFWIPSLAGPTAISARQTGSSISWLFPFVDGHPPLGWSETLAYLVLPVLLVVSQFVSMQIMQPPQTDPSQKNAQFILKFLPLMIGYFALSVPSGLSLYWLTNNILSTGQQVWLRKLGGASPAVGTDGDGIISAGQAKRSTTILTDPNSKESRRGERFKQLKAEELKKKAERAEAAKKAAEEASKAAAAAGAKERERLLRAQKSQEAEESNSDSEIENEDDSEVDDQEDGTLKVSLAKDSLEGLYVGNGNGAAEGNNTVLRKSKRSKRRRTA
ncbi:hypothetical protein O6H91_14G069800 [Diphasiastrum complanatum]|uniref:Uncharacterized protein n=1 Tax=Diphasiastrum complanatum TaxID=34168 RepID=A0ACC2BQV2_DIPCM|nr:hypothetical protein O6H91_14G069800 [Diphasiastrum complanatum]